MDILSHCLLTERLTDFLAELNIPAVRYSSGSREAGSLQRLVQSQMIACTCLLTNSMRSVGTVHRRNIKAWNRPRLPLSLSSYDGCLLNESHRTHYIFMFHSLLLP